MRFSSSFNTAGIALVLAALLSALGAVAPGGAWTCSAHAQGSNPLNYVRTDRWIDAQAAAARVADPVAEKLVLYLRLRAPGAATSSEIADFMRRNPDWPAQEILERRREEAIAVDPDDASVLSQCGAAPLVASPTLAPAMLRCAEAIANAGRTTEANALARQAWVSAIDSAAGEAAFLRRWAGVASSDDEWTRFERLAWLPDPAAAARQVARVDATHRAVAEARLAAKRDDPQTEALVAALPAPLRADPGLSLDRARAMDHAGRDADAAALLVQTQDTANPGAFWPERNLLARKLLHDGDPKAAYAVVGAHGQLGDEQRADAEFLAGFIALRMLHDPASGQTHFAALTGSRAIITQGRAHYWLARAAAAAGKDPRAEYEKAAAWPTSFYGQLAILALGETPLSRIAKLSDPTWSRDTALAFTEHEVLRAAAWLIAWGDPQRARVFLTRMDELAPIPAERTLTAVFALTAGVPDSAVFVARRMGRDGLALPHAGWPAPFDPAAPPDPAFSLGVMRQESSFDVGALSPSGARGLMQLMPPTAAAVARQLGISVSLPGLTSDSASNIRLGTAYLQEVLTRFDNCLPLAAAAYNAGPHRVAQWLDQNGDPRTGPIDMVDWIELIPISETRNYVQRVTENTVMYRASRNDASPVLTTAPWSR
jgi:soluble lytic murein transglycosylase